MESAKFMHPHIKRKLAVVLWIQALNNLTFAIMQISGIFIFLLDIYGFVDPYQTFQEDKGYILWYIRTYVALRKENF